MRKIVVMSMITLDGVMQAPGGPEEDTSGDFKHGGWAASYDDKAIRKYSEIQMKPADILLGRKTFEIFASYWPKHADEWPGINEVTKYVVSKTMESSKWINSVILKDLAQVKELKDSEGPDIKVWGSSKLVQSLLGRDLVDELWLNIFPLTLGKGKKLFDGNAVPAAFKIVEGTVTPSGVIIAHFKRDGEVKTGTVGTDVS